MKIRWTQHSVRFRISPSEYAALESGQTVKESIRQGEFIVWTAEIVPSSVETCIEAHPGLVRVLLSVEDRQRMAVPDLEGVYFVRDGDPRLRYYIEKDLPCAHPRSPEAHEPIDDTFEAPPGFSGRKSGSGPSVP